MTIKIKLKLIEIIKTKKLTKEKACLELQDAKNSKITLNGVPWCVSLEKYDIYRLA
jgi:hypothetical protein